MAERVLTLRELNRATLARQLLLERRKVAVVPAVERLAGLQAQWPPSPYVGLWSRVAGFRRESLERAIREGKVVKATVMRGTLHLLAARDYPVFWTALRDMPTWFDETHLAHALLAVPGIRALAEECDPVRIRNFFTALHDEYWDFHYTLTSRRRSARMALVGETRVTEMLDPLEDTVVVVVDDTDLDDVVETPDDIRRTREQMGETDHAPRSERRPDRTKAQAGESWRGHRIARTTFFFSGLSTGLRRSLRRRRRR